MPFAPYPPDKHTEKSLMIDTDFTQPLMLPWRLTEIGGGIVRQSPDALHLTIPSASPQIYSDAQISDYAGKPDFRWHPPVRMTVRGYAGMSPEPDRNQPFGHVLKGTAGFGFWNHPFVPGERGFRLPQAVWFFYSAPPSNMALAKDVPGQGWKAATINAVRWPFLALLPTAPVGLLLMRIPALYERLWPVGQRAIGVRERLLDSHLLLYSHTYMIEWHINRVIFLIDGQPVYEAQTAIKGPLGFIAWIDNQFAVVTPQGQFGFGLVEIPSSQSLVIESIRIEAL
ncbi:MAG: hypothetical protein K8I30_04790 [Anaerolineae bacterium]|nr:hypothetical protein [Anaerolineae bacterium]